MRELIYRVKQRCPVFNFGEKRKPANYLAKVESERQISLPEIYKAFYWRCYFFIPGNLLGTDLDDKYCAMNDAAAGLLEEKGIPNFLERDDFVFMMHQGYIFWYFRANGDPNPIVYSYFEGKSMPERVGTFSEFMKASHMALLSNGFIRSVFLGVVKRL